MNQSKVFRFHLQVESAYTLDVPANSESEARGIADRMIKQGCAPMVADEPYYDSGEVKYDNEEKPKEIKREHANLGEWDEALEELKTRESEA